MKAIGFMLLLLGASAIAGASVDAAPEIDANSAGSALALLSGSLLILKSRRRK